MICLDCLHYRPTLTGTHFCELTGIYMHDGVPVSITEGCKFEPIDL